VLKEPVLIAGGGGFIGGHLAHRLEADGHTDVRVADCRPIETWEQVVPGFDNVSLDLRDLEAVRQAVAGRATVFHLAADMGGVGFLLSHRVDCMLSVVIGANLVQAAAVEGVERIFFASSACVYDVTRQEDAASPGLREEDAYPAWPEDGYGWEKLFTERLLLHAGSELGIEPRIGRFHNVYGPNGAWAGGREKAPAALCRKVATAVRSGSPTIEIWGDGKQTRSFLYVDDAVEGVLRLTASHVDEPLNIGSDRLVTIDEVVDIIEAIAGVHLERRYLADAPQGVRGRNSDNTRIRARLGWEPSIPLERGLERTYRWVYDELSRTG